MPHQTNLSSDLNINLESWNHMESISWFPEMGVPPNHPFLDHFSRILPYWPSILGYPGVLGYLRKSVLIGSHTSDDSERVTTTILASSEIPGLAGPGHECLQNVRRILPKGCQKNWTISRLWPKCDWFFGHENHEVTHPGLVELFERAGLHVMKCGSHTVRCLRNMFKAWAASASVFHAEFDGSHGRWVVLFQDLGNDQAIWVWQPSIAQLWNAREGWAEKASALEVDTELDIWLVVSTLFPFHTCCFRGLVLPTHKWIDSVDGIRLDIRFHYVCIYYVCFLFI